MICLLTIRSTRCDSARSRLHSSEPALCMTSPPSVPRLYRLQSLQPTHEESNIDTITHAPSVPIKIGVLSAIKAPMRRKISLTNLFTVSKFVSRGKPSKNRDTTPMQRLSIPSDSEKGAFNPLARVRSRSAPFCEMSPIQESFGDSPSDSQENYPSGDRKLSPTVLHVPLERFDMETDQNRESKAIKLVETDAGPTICFLGSSDESCSSDSERNFGSLAAPTRRGVESHSLISLQSTTDISDHLPSNIEMNATTHPLLPEMQPVSPNPNRSPRGQTVSPVNLSKPLTVAPVHGTTPSRPSPCQRRSSESEINVTPKGLTSLRHLDFYVLTDVFLFIER